MREIKLKISEGVFKEIKKTFNIRVLGQATFGVADSALFKILLSMEQGDSELMLIFKDEVEE